MHARLGNPPSLTAAVYLAATMEYIAAEILELSGNAARDSKASWIQPRHVQLALRNDEELNMMFQNVSILDGGVLPNIHAVLLPRWGRHGGSEEDKDKVVETMQAYLKDYVLEEEFEDFGGSDCFVSGTRPHGFTKAEIVENSYENGLGGSHALSAGAAWVHAFESDDDGSYIPFDSSSLTLGRFTTLSKEDQAALLKPSRDKAGGCAEEVEAATLPSATLTCQQERRRATESEAFANRRTNRHQKILRDNIQGITREMIMALAARAGCLMLSGLVYEEIRGIAKVYLDNLIRDAVALADHKRRKIVFATDVLAAATSQVAGRIVCGTGRVASMYANSGCGGGGTPSAFAKLAAAYSAKLARGQDADGDKEWAYPAAYRGDDEEEYLDMCNEDGFNEAVTNAWTADLYEDDDWTRNTVDEEYGEEFRGRARHASGMPYLTKDEIYANPRQASGSALRYIRQMQRTSGPCLPFMPLAMLIREIAQDYKTGLDFEPEAFRVMQSMLEDYLVGLFEDANLNCIHGGGSSNRTFPFTGFDAEDPQREKRSFAILPKDLQLARRIRNERA